MKSVPAKLLQKLVFVFKKRVIFNLELPECGPADLELSLINYTWYQFSTSRQDI